MKLPRANLGQRFGFFLGLLVCAALGACKDNPVGRQCFIPSSESDGGVPVTVVGTGLECQSRVCLHIASRNPDMCTGDCSSDSDCEASPETPCQGGFACVVPVVVGDFCCQKLCVCKDYLNIPDGGIPEPAACVASNPVNECCNLEGRRGNSQYPGCP